jgi:hypothetical protein
MVYSMHITITNASLYCTYTGRGIGPPQDVADAAWTMTEERGHGTVGPPHRTGDLSQSLGLIDKKLCLNFMLKWL